ncbi:MAG: YfhO family protein [Lentisphaerae bacterium]|nr:YfhO family protein [Lentisphaerota bacterium]
MTRKAVIAGLAVLAGLVLITVFWAPLFSGETLFSADQAPFFRADYQKHRLMASWGIWVPRLAGSGGGGKPFHPLLALSMLLPPLVYHVASYVCSLVLILLGGVFFLRGRGMPRVPAFLGAMAMAFAGYGFTLISAGHRSIFNMMAYAIFMFAFLDRALGRRSFLYFALAGAFAGFGLMSQPDVMGLILLTAAAYGSLRFMQEMIASPDRRAGITWRVLAGGLVALLFLAAVGSGWYERLTRTIIPRRERQMTMTGARTPEEKWIFTTNWSMPPEEIVEFVAPGIYGFETGHPDGPYWGRVGRSWKWGEHRQGLMNLRQHTVYLGVLQLLFAVYAVAGAARRKFPGPGRRADVWFWAGAAVLSVLLALGRYFPLYRLFHALPVASKIRAPIKFIHITDISVAVLFAFGVALFLRDLKAARSKEAPEIESVRKRLAGFAAGSGAAGLLLWIAAGVLGSFEPGFTKYWRELGLDRFAPLLMERMQGALVHGGVLFIAGAAIFAAARWMRSAATAGCAALGLLLVIVPLDMALVGRRYVHVRDVSAVYAPNPVAERILAEPEPARTAYYLSPRGTYDVLWRSFNAHGVFMMNPGPHDRLSEAYQTFFEAFQENLLRLWQITNTRFIIGARQQLGGLIEHPAIEVEMDFEVVNGRLREVARGRGRFVLLRFNGCLPRALVYHDWEQREPADALERMTSAEWNPYATVLVSGEVGLAAPGGEPTAARLAKYETTHVEVDVRTPASGLLLLNDKYDEDWTVTVDGKPAGLLRCNYLMRGVALTAGRHRVVFSYRPWLAYFVINVLACIVLAGWGVAAGCKTFRRPDRRG